MVVPAQLEAGLETNAPSVRLDAFFYHRSDARNGFFERPNESANGAGIRVRVPLD
jgi:hypothetical protein